MEKLEELKSLLTGAEQTAATMLQDKDQGKSPHVAPLRARLSAALESLEWHTKWVADSQEPAAASPKAKAKG